MSIEVQSNSYDRHYWAYLSHFDIMLHHWPSVRDDPEYDYMLNAIIHQQVAVLRDSSSVSDSAPLFLIACAKSFSSYATRKAECKWGRLPESSLQYKAYSLAVYRSNGMSSRHLDTSWQDKDIV